MESACHAGEMEDFGALIAFVADFLDEGLGGNREQDQHRASEGKKEGVNVCFEDVSQFFHSVQWYNARGVDLVRSFFDRL